MVIRLPIFLNFIIRLWLYHYGDILTAKLHTNCGKNGQIAVNKEILLNSFPMFLDLAVQRLIRPRSKFN